MQAASSQCSLGRSCIRLLYLVCPPLQKESGLSREERAFPTASLEAFTTAASLRERLLQERTWLTFSGCLRKSCSVLFPFFSLQLLQHIVRFPTLSVPPELLGTMWSISNWTLVASQ